MRKFTLDTNCIIDVAEDRPGAAHVKLLLKAVHEGLADLALVASSASERQEGGHLLESFTIFQSRCDALGVGDLPKLPSIGRFGISFFNNCLHSSPEMLAREHDIFATLFPTSPPKWKDYAAVKGLSPDDLESKGYRLWRNRMLDAQAFWAHDYAERDVFVTSDRNFLRLEGHQEFPRVMIRDPAQAAALI